MYTCYQRIHDFFIVLLLEYAIQTEACVWLNLNLFWQQKCHLFDEVFKRWYTRNRDMTDSIDLQDSLCLLKEKQAELTFPNIATSLKIGLTIPITS